MGPLSNYTLDRAGFIFALLSLPIVCWAVFDTRGFLRFLSYGRRTVFTNFQLMSVRVPGIIVVIALCLMIITTLVIKR